MKIKEKQKNLLKNVASRKFKTERAAAVAAGYSPQMTNRSLTRAIQSSHRNYLNALVKAGTTDAKSARVISEAMDATGFSKSGQEFPNHKARLTANEQYLKVKRLLGADEEEKRIVPQTTIVIIRENEEKSESVESIDREIQIN